jgi:uncharacterized C2H2 Zn-finger protein
MIDGAWLLLRCPHCDHQFGFDPYKLSLPTNNIQCPDCQQYFMVRISFVVEKISSVVPPKT